METSSLGKTQRRGPTGARRRIGRAATGVLIAVGFGATALLTVGAPASAATRTTTTASAPITPGAMPSITLQRVGTVNLGALAGPAAARARHVASSTEGPNYPHHIAPLGLIHHGTTANASVSGHNIPSGVLDAITGSDAGATSFDALNAATNSSVNSPNLGGVGDISPPDQGLAVGPSPAGTAIVEFINDSLAIYSPSGKVLLPPVSAFQALDLPGASFLSDPRVYWDPSSGHWFLTMFVASGSPGTAGPDGCSSGGYPGNNCESAEFVAVSSTSNPMGVYDVFWFDTTDGSNSEIEPGDIGSGCPCFGDYDQVGMDSSGFYITTNEFCISSSDTCGGQFNGTIIYAMSRKELIAAAEGAKSLPAVHRYGVDYNSDPFGAYHLSPSNVAQGSSAPDTEYFVESNANAPTANSSTSGLEVYALLGTSALDSGGTPTFVMNSVATEAYTGSPPNAVQKSGPIPFGNLVGVGTTPAIETDFNATQATTYASGVLYTELDTGFLLGNQENSGAAWFALRPTAGASSVTVANAGNGYVETSQDLLYPVISVNASGDGFLAFSIAGPAMYPSAAYVTFDGTRGAGDVVHIVAAGAAPQDDFSCYAPYPACRWGDYSAGQAYNGNIYMASEYIPPDTRDTYADWGTRIYWAPEQGYWVAGSDGNVAATGNAPRLAGTSVSGSKSIVGIASTAAGEGYWLVGRDGSVTARGDAPWLGDLPAMGINVSNIVAVAPTSDGRGYWLVGSDGGIFAFGDAHYRGSLPGIGVKVSNVVGMVSTPNGEGYWMVGSDGGVFAFGQTHFVGSLPGLGIHVNDIRAITNSPTGRGYVLVGSDGGAFVFGSGAAFVGSLPGEGIHVSDIVGLALTPDGHGYWLAGSNGAVYALGNADNFAVPGSVSKNLPVAAIAGT